MMLSSKVIDKEKTETVTLAFSPPRFENTVEIDESQLQNIENSAFELDETQKIISGLESKQKEKLADQIRIEVLNQVKTIQEEAYEKGFQLGLEEGKALALQETLHKLEGDILSFKNLSDSFHKQFEEMAKHNELRIIDLIFKIGLRLACHELSVNKEAIIELVRQTVSATVEEDDITLEISPEMLEFFESLKSKSNRELDFLKNIKIESNIEIKEGGCRVKTHFGQIDAQIEIRSSNLWSQITNVLPKVSNQ